MKNIFIRNLKTWSAHVTGEQNPSWIWTELGPTYESLFEGGWEEIMAMIGLNLDNAYPLFCWCCLVFDEVEHPFTQYDHEAFFNTLIPDFQRQLTKQL